MYVKKIRVNNDKNDCNVIYSFSVKLKQVHHFNIFLTDAMSKQKKTSVPKIQTRFSRIKYVANNF